MDCWISSNCMEHYSFDFFTIGFFFTGLVYLMTLLPVFPMILRAIVFTSFLFPQIFVFSILHVFPSSLSVVYPKHLLEGVLWHCCSDWVSRAPACRALHCLYMLSFERNYCVRLLHRRSWLEDAQRSLPSLFVPGASHPSRDYHILHSRSRNPATTPNFGWAPYRNCMAQEFPRFFYVSKWSQKASQITYTPYFG